MTTTMPVEILGQVRVHGRRISVERERSEISLHVKGDDFYDCFRPLGAIKDGRLALNAGQDWPQANSAEESDLIQACEELYRQVVGEKQGSRPGREAGDDCRTQIGI